MSISDKIIIMNAGKIAQMGTPHEIYYHPVSEFVADFIGDANFLKGRMVRHEGNVDVVEIYGQEVKVDGTGDRIAVGAETTVVLRPESTVLCDEGVLPCEVIVSTFMGAYQLYHVMVGDTKLIIHEYNPKGKKNTKGLPVRWEIRSLDDVDAILQGAEEFPASMGWT